MSMCRAGESLIKIGLQLLLSFGVYKLNRVTGGGMKIGAGKRARAVRKDIQYDFSDLPTTRSTPLRVALKRVQTPPYDSNSVISRVNSSLLIVKVNVIFRYSF